VRRLALLLACIAFAWHASAAEGVFDFNQASLPQGTSVVGSATLLTTDGFTGGSVRLVNSAQFQQGSFIVADIANGAPVSGFTATFKLRQDNPSSPPADGWSFNFATDLPSTSFGVEGAGSGLTVAFDTFDNGGGEAPAVNARWRGIELAVARPGLATMLTSDGGTSPWADVLVRMDEDGTLDVAFDGVSIFSNLQTPYIPQVGARLGIGGQTGGFFTTIAVDDFTFSTRSSVVAFNSTKEFSVANGNPNGVWSYGFMPGDFSSFTRYSTSTPGTASFAMWNTPGFCGDGTPAIGRNQTTSSLCCGIGPGQVSLHPGCGGQVSSLRFIAPTAGNYTFGGRFLPGDGGAMQVGVRRGSTMLFQATDQGSFTLRDVALAAGDAVDMVVFGGYAFGNTPLDLQVTVPIGPTTDLLVTAPTTATAGSAFDVSVTPRDSSGRTDTTYRGTIVFTSVDATASLPADYTFVESDLGTRAFPGGITLRRAGATTITVTDATNGALRGTRTVNVAAAALSASASTLTAASGTLESDGVTTTTITVTPTDAFGNRRGAGAAVVITTTAGTLLGAVRDVGDGT
jgi:hypothetical protein